MATETKTQKFSRKTYDQQTRDRITGLVRSGQMSVQEVCKKENLQPYQVYAWIGEQALAAELRNPSPPGGMDGMALQMDEAAMTDPDLARAIGEWWLKTHTIPVKPK